LGYEITDTETTTIEGFAGVEVTFKLATTFAEYEALQRIAESGTAGERDAAFEDFGDKFIESWNLTSKGEELEPNGASFNRLPLGLKLGMTARWLELMTGPSVPLGQESSNGLDSPEPSTTEPESE